MSRKGDKRSKGQARRETDKKPMAQHILKTRYPCTQAAQLVPSRPPAVHLVTTLLHLRRAPRQTLGRARRRRLQRSGPSGPRLLPEVGRSCLARAALESCPNVCPRAHVTLRLSRPFSSLPPPSPPPHPTNLEPWRSGETARAVNSSEGILGMTPLSVRCAVPLAGWWWWWLVVVQRTGFCGL